MKEEKKINKSAARQKRYRDRIALNGGMTVTMALTKEAADIVRANQRIGSPAEIINMLIIRSGI